MNEALLLLLLSAAVRAEPAPPPLVRVSLEEAELSARENSPTLKALDAEAEAARDQALSRYAQLWPRLSADANWKYLSDIPELSVLGRSISLGAHDNYSVGPTLNWTLWDQGSLRQGWRSAQAAARSKEEDGREARRQVVHRARAAYFQAQLALEQVRVLADSLRLAQSQHKDIEDRRRAGASSLIDSLSSHQEVLARQRSFSQARADLAGSLRDLYALMGRQPEADLSLPVGVELSTRVPEGTDAATAAIALDPIAESLARLEPARLAALDEEHPALRRWGEAASSYRDAEQSLKASLWPRLLFTARTSLDYPNGPIHENFNQNSVGAALSFPLFERGATRSQAAQQARLADAADRRRDQARSDLRRDWLKARDRLLSLRTQAALDKTSVQETRDLSRRYYESYKAGRSTFLEVQSANLRELEAKVQEARTQTQILMELAELSDLTEKESRP